ncbi:MAG: glycosyltransferase [Pseudomonadota bacterium]
MPNTARALIIDPLAFAIRATGGVSRVWATLLPRFLASDIPIRLSSGVDAREALRGGVEAAMPFLKGGNLIPATLRRFMPYAGGGVFFPTAPRPCLAGIANVQLVHDCIKDLYYAPPKVTLARIRRQRIYNNASALIAISDATRLDLVRAYGDEVRDRISVIYNPVDAGYILGCTQKASVPEEYSRIQEEVMNRPFAVFIGARAWVKNFREVAHLLEALPDHVVIAIGPLPTTDEKAMALAMGGRILFVGHVKDEVMFRLLKQSEFLFWPSMLEGFGLPIVESLLLGTPVMGLSTQVNLDVSMGLISQFESGSAASMRAAYDRLHRLAPDDPMHAQLVARYDPDTVAERYLQVIRKLL